MSQRGWWGFPTDNTVKLNFRKSVYAQFEQSGGVQKLSGAVFCTRVTAEKLTILDQTNGESV